MIRGSRFRINSRALFLTATLVLSAGLTTLIWYHDHQAVGWRWLGDLKVYREAARVLLTGENSTADRCRRMPGDRLGGRRVLPFR